MNSKKISLVVGIILFIYIVSSAQTFKQTQLGFPRVREAYNKKESKIDSLFSSINVSYPPEEILIRAFKLERLLELWAKDTLSVRFILVKTYPMTSSSGKLGPKRAEGDLQIPEGFYHIDRFNPASNYHLSLGINYPNKSDIIRKKGKNAGGDIFIHGSNVTIGCVPIGNSAIKELYAIAVDVKSEGQSKIPVHIFPFIMNSAAADSILTDYSDRNIDTFNFWGELIPVYRYFENNKEIPEIKIDNNGKYIIANGTRNSD